MELLELVIFLLAAIVVSSVLDQVLHGVSLPLVQIAIGVVIAFVFPLSSSVQIDSELLLVLFIAPLHFNESRHVDSGNLYRNRLGIASLVTGLVLLTMATVGFTLHALVPAIPLAAALAFGAAMGSTDAAAVTALAKDMRFGRRHESLLMGEALFNDVMGTVGFSCALAVVVSGVFSLKHAGEEFALELFGGMVAGAVLGLAFWALVMLLRRFGLENPTVHVVLELVTPFLIYLVCEQVHVGGVIAVVMAGMVFSLLPQRHTAALAQQRLQSASVWKLVEFVLNGIIFVVLGMQIPRVLMPALETSFGHALFLVGCVVVLTLVLEAVRFLWILGLDAVHAWRAGAPVRSCFARASLKGTLGMALAGPKGGVTLALMLTIPVAVDTGEAFPLRDEILFLTSGVILCTMLLANFAVKKVVPHKPHERRSRAYADGEIALLVRVISSIRADAHLTGAVTGEAPSVPEDERGDALPADVDEPATAIVMKRYADRIRTFLPQASPELAAKGRALADRCDELYEQADALADALDRVDEDMTDDDLMGLSVHFEALKKAREAIDDIQDQALVRELEFIKAMRRAGQLSAEHARELRNDVYIQQLTM